MKQAAFLRSDLSLAADSYYAATAPRANFFAPLDGRVEADVAIVGGGLAGLSAAIELADRGHRVVLLEAREIAWAGSGRNGGQAIHGYACDMATLEHHLGDEGARLAWSASLEALDMLRERCSRFAIDAEWRDGFLYVACNERKARKLREDAESLARKYDHPLRWIGPEEMPSWIASPAYHAGLYDERSGHLHPLKYARGLACAAAGLGVALHENTPVLGLDRGPTNRLRTPRGEVHARHVLLAGNVYLQSLAPELASRIMPVGTYMAATEPLDPVQLHALIPSRAAVCDNNFVLDYWRPSADGRLLFGGRVSYSTRTPANLRETMQQRIEHVFPQLTGVPISHVWGGFVDITMNRAPDFGRLPARLGKPANVYYLQGFSGHGLALTGLAGRLVAEAIHGDASRFDVFARLKHMPFPGGALLRTPALVAGMAWYRLRDLLF